MKCKVCNCEVGSGIAKCSRCGFPVLQMVNGGAEEEKYMNELASSIRKKKFDPVRIYMTVYTNKIEENRAKAVKEDQILLAKGDQMLHSDILWYPEKFAQLSGECRVKLNIIHTNSERCEISVDIQNPQINDFWQIGVRPLAGMEFQLVLGNQTTYRCSDRISYL